MREDALLFGKTRSLVGIITDPPQAEGAKHLPAVILLNSGLVHRVGPNRLYVKLARSLAAIGFVVLRFDLSGIGDSQVRDDHLPFEKSAVSETKEAMDALSAARGIEQFLLSGICSGAQISLTTAYCDPRVVGVIPINAQRYQIESDTTVRSYMQNYRAAYRYWEYWKTALFNSKIWLKAITGQADYRMMMRWTIQTMYWQIKSKVSQQRIVSSRAHHAVTGLHTLAERGVRLLFVYSAGDPGLDSFHVMLGNKIHALRTSGKLRVELIPQADHTFTLLESQDSLLHIIRNWAVSDHRGRRLGLSNPGEVRLLIRKQTGNSIDQHLIGGPHM